MAETALDADVRELAGRIRSTRLHELATEVYRLIVEAMPDYLRRGGLTSAELQEACTHNVDRMLAELAGARDEGEHVEPDFLPATGRRRAQQRIPLESVLYSFRLGGRVIWEGLVTEARRSHGAAGLHTLLSQAVAVWDVLDRVSTVVAVAYRDEQARLHRRTQRHQEAVLDALIEGSLTTGAAAAEAADVLGVPEHGPCLVVVAATDPSVVEHARSPRTALADAGLVSAWTVTGARDSGLVALRSPSDAEQVLHILATAAAGAVAVSPVLAGFEDVATAHRFGLLVLRSLDPAFTGVVRATDRLPHALLVANRDIGRLAARHALGGLLTLPPHKRDLYLDTIEAVAAAGGSSAEAARALYCHRNTLLKRAGRIEAVTGLRLTHAGELLALHLAVLASRLDA